jgi:hypothetical protein
MIRALFKISNLAAILFTAGLLYACVKDKKITLTHGPYKKIAVPKTLAMDNGGNFYFVNQGDCTVLKASPSGTITKIAGTDTILGCSGDGGPATSAHLSFDNICDGIVLDKLGNVFFSDDGCSLIHEINGVTGTMTLIAGNGSYGYGGDGGQATIASLFDPGGMAMDTAGNVYFTDKSNYRVRKITKATGIITTVAGNGSQKDSGDAGPATSAAILDPIGVTVDDSNNLYVASYYKIRKVYASNGKIVTIAGTSKTKFNGDGIFAWGANIMPATIVLDASKNIYFTDCGNFRVRRIDNSTGIITTVAGNGAIGYGGDGGLATNATMNTPIGLAIDASGNLYFTDSGNNCIRKITVSTGIITTVVHN